jgi:hypothetical protein
LLNALTCSSVAPVSTVVLLVELGRVFAFGVVGVRFPFGFGVVFPFGFVVGGLFGCGFFGVFISMLPILICADAPMAKSRVTKHNVMSRVGLVEECLFILDLLAEFE